MEYQHPLVGAGPGERILTGVKLVVDRGDDDVCQRASQILLDGLGRLLGVQRPEVVMDAATGESLPCRLSRRAQYCLCLGFREASPRSSDLGL